MSFYARKTTLLKVSEVLSANACGFFALFSEN